jgi:hypothetical protein
LPSIIVLHVPRTTAVTARFDSSTTLPAADRSTMVVGAQHYYVRDWSSVEHFTSTSIAP